MCGIVGILDSEDANLNGSLHCMTHAIKHRGPDADGFYAKSYVGLGMRRLSIIDLNTGDQPMSNEDGTVWAVFNGEIYNYVELREKLILKGHIFKTQSDTEVIVHQFEEDGELCVEKFRGMFAIAIWDTKRKQLVLMRDHFGIKPLFLAEEIDKLAFASEMKALFNLPWINRNWNPIALRAYLSLGYIPAPLTAYVGIRKFPPGTIEVWQVESENQISRIKTLCYWKPTTAQEKVVPTFEEAAERVMGLLKDSIKLHLRSDVPLGAFLSGGVDSSSVVALMRLCGVGDLKTFSIGFEDSGLNELPYAAQVAQHLMTEHYSHIITGREAQDLFPVIENFDEPYADSSAIPTYFVSRLAREHVTVSLSGDGGDELFSGYTQYPRLRRYRFVDKIPQPARELISDIGSRLVREDKRGGGFFRRFGVPPEARHLSFMSNPVEGLMLDTLSVSLRDFLLDQSLDKNWQGKYWCGHSVSEAQLVDQKTYLPDDILTKVDITSMRVSLEARVPLLDHVLADQVNRLPTSYKLKNGNSKRLLKRVIAPLLPHGIFDRPKNGFAVPLRLWLTGPMKQNVQELLLDNPTGILNPDGVKSLISAMEHGERPLMNRQVWKLLVLSVWANRQSESKPF